MTANLEQPHPPPHDPTVTIHISRHILMSLLLLLVLGGVVGLAVAQTPGQTEFAIGDRSGTITVPISLYILVNDVQDPNPRVSSDRTEADLLQIVDGMNDVWRQADIAFVVQSTAVLEVSQPLLFAMGSGHPRSFYASDFDVPGAAVITSFYAHSIGGPNGINPLNSRTFFVTDHPSVAQDRVSAHEVGHILGLHHVLEDDERLMASGVDGLVLTDEEITVARYVAWGILNNLR